MNERTALAEEKRALRARLVAARARLSPDDRAAAARRIAEGVAALPAFAAARTLALYAPLGGEVDTSDIMRRAVEAGLRLAFPRTDPDERLLRFATCAPEALVRGSRAYREPPADAPPVALSEIDLVLVPGVAFDPVGGRLGRGAGYYDATLAALPTATPRVGIGFELQVVPSVPHEPHDALLDALVTEAATRAFRARLGAPSGRLDLPH